jgi:hypothetical protein
MLPFGRPECFIIPDRGVEQTKTGKMYKEAYGSYPLEIRNDQTHQVIDMERFIKARQRIVQPDTYSPFEMFADDSTYEMIQLSGLNRQKILHETLRDQGFDFSKIPFKLQKWDPVSNQWIMLKIDCQLMAVSYLTYLEKKKEAADPFIDRKHKEQLLAFETTPVRENGVTFMVVTPLLITPTPKPGEKEKEWLRICLSGNVSFPALKITSPAVMQPPKADFTCHICFDDITSIAAGENVFQTGCGNDSGHCFHRHCIEAWFAQGKSSCPNCRTIIKNII